MRSVSTSETSSASQMYAEHHIGSKNLVQMLIDFVSTENWSKQSSRADLISLDILCCILTPSFAIDIRLTPAIPQMSCNGRRIRGNVATKSLLHIRNAFERLQYFTIRATAILHIYCAISIHNARIACLAVCIPCRQQRCQLRRKLLATTSRKKACRFQL